MVKGECIPVQVVLEVCNWITQNQCVALGEMALP